MNRAVASALAVAFAPSAIAQSPLHTWQASQGDSRVAVIADVNGDGGADVAIGGWDFFASPQGSVRLYSGIDGSLLNAWLDATPASEFGDALASAGDVDQDGAGDVVVGAWGRDDNGIDSGRVFVFSGATGSPATPLFAIDGATGDALGYGVAGGLDVDGDGVPDFAATAQIVQMNPAPPYLRVFSGATGAPVLTITATAEPFAGTFDLIGDVDLDGFADVVTGNYSYGSPTLGHVDVFSGATGARIKTFTGLAPSDGFGFQAARAGDVDADGREDVLVSILPLFGVPSAVRVYSGAGGQVLQQWGSPNLYQQFGSSVATAGDVDADGHADVIVGASAGEAPGANLNDDVGTVGVYSGRTGHRLYFAAGTQLHGHLGSSVAGGDLDGDGLGDFVAASDLATTVVAYPECPDLTEEYGAGCAGSGGFVPSLAAGGCTDSNGFVSIGISGAFGHTTGFLFLGASEIAAPLPSGCTLLVGPLFPATVPLVFGGAGPGAGIAHAGATLPAIASTAVLTAQAIVIDPQVARGYSASNAVRFTFTP